MIFVTTCAGCNQPGETLCRRCRFSLVTTSPVFTDGGVGAAMPFEGVARQAVIALKYRNRRGIARQLAAVMVKRLLIGRHATRVDLVTWAPTTTAHIGERGFDQAELLARAVARELGVPCRRLLYRAHGVGQTGRSRRDRLQAPEFRARPPRRRTRVLLVDDVVTTGATLHAAADALRVAGFADVRCIAAAATPCASPAMRHLSLVS